MYFIVLCVGIALAYLIAALSPNMDVANAALPGEGERAASKQPCGPAHSDVKTKSARAFLPTSRAPSASPHGVSPSCPRLVRPAGFVVTLLFFAGCLMTFSAIPAWWGWYSRINFLRYAWGARECWDGLRVGRSRLLLLHACLSDRFPVFRYPAYTASPPPPARTVMANQFENNDVVFAGSQTILEYYGLKYANKWAYVGYLSIFWAVFVILAWAALSFVRHQRR